MNDTAKKSFKVNKTLFKFNKRNFKKYFNDYSDPTCSKIRKKSGWPPVTAEHLIYENIETPYVFKVSKLTHEQRDMLQFYDKIYELR